MDTHRHYVTYFDRNYLAKGLAMLRSLARHESRPMTVFVVCMDELTRVIVNRLRLDFVVTVPLHAIERGDDALVGPRQERELVEYYWTLTPTIILRLLEWGQANETIEVLTYLDADLFFFSSPDPIFEELGERSVLIHEHRFSADLTHLAENGRFNVGLMCFRNDAAGRNVLSWWRDRCNEWCFKRIEDGKMGDQLYLEDWPTRFEDVVVLQNVGAGVAPWNQRRYRHETGPAGPLVDGVPVVFYHFHAFTVVSKEVVVPAAHAVYRLTVDMLESLVVPYAEAVATAFDEVQAAHPTFRFGIEGARAIDPQCVIVARTEVADAIAQAGLPHRRAPLCRQWDVHAAAQLLPRTSEVQRGVCETPRKDVASPARSPQPVSIAAAFGADGCMCPLQQLSASAPEAELVVAVPPSWVSAAEALLEGRDARIVVTEPGTPLAQSMNLALALTRHDTIVVAEPAGARPTRWVDALVSAATTQNACVRGQDAIVTTRASLERAGGLESTFDDLAAALDDFALRMHAHEQPVAVVDTPRIYAPEAWRQMAARWGVPPELGQTGSFPSALAPPSETLRRVAFPDPATTHVVDAQMRRWVPRDRFAA